MSARYGVDPDAVEGTTTSRGIILEWVEQAQNILDVGCSTGGLGGALVARGKQVVGLDIDNEATLLARERGVDARVCNLEIDRLSEVVDGRLFDCIVFGDVLEHLVEPGAVLLDARSILEPDGFVLVSIPNVANASVRLALLTNRWDGRDIGLLDRTHLRFFTLDSFLDLAFSAGFMAVRIDRVRSDTRNRDHEHVLALKGVDLIPEVLVDAAHAGPEADTLQFIIRLEPVDIGESDAQVARLAAVRARIDLRDALRELEFLRGEVAKLPDFEAEREAMQLEVLRVRDAMIGMGAALAEARSQIREWQYLRDRDMQNYEELAEAFRAANASITWRVGRIVTFPLRAVRGVLRRLRSVG
jgi:SAM-dependent methyltransferase